MSTICNLENGRRGLKDDTLYRLARALGVEPAVLFDTKPVPPTQKRHTKPQDAA